MTKTVHRFFAGMLGSQTRWLNKMAHNGYRLINTTTASYQFESCEPDEYQYTVEYIGNWSKEHADTYMQILEDCGYRVFYKNINLNYSAGKVVLRPWAEKGGRIATTSTTLNRELLIVEKKQDGKPFELHSNSKDRIQYYKSMQRPWIFLLLLWLILYLLVPNVVWLVLCGLTLLGLLPFQIELLRLKKCT